MRIIFAINHPAQYHLFKNIYQALKIKGHQVDIVIKGKDILEELLIIEGINYVRLTNKHIGNNKVSILIKGFIDFIVQDIKLLFFVLKNRPTLMVGTDYSITHIGKCLKIPSVVFNEDDFEINKIFCWLAYPLGTCIVSPSCCDVGKFESKRISYNGYQKLAYLHPLVFQPDQNVVKKYIDPTKRYFLIRLVSFSAIHDIELNHGGLTLSNINELIYILKQYGEVFITSESVLPNNLEIHRLKINSIDIHHLLAFASIFIGDSQSMIVESAMLGTPSIRFNSFVGKISVLAELENHYGLTVGISNNRPDLLIRKVKEMVVNKYLKDIFIERRDKMLLDKIVVSTFFTWLIENYPKSKALLKEDPNYISKFRYKKNAN
jgi:uncharacterized protein